MEPALELRIRRLVVAFALFGAGRAAVVMRRQLLHFR
jgi:hypothetical protein